MNWLVAAIQRHGHGRDPAKASETWFAFLQNVLNVLDQEPMRRPLRLAL